MASATDYDAIIIGSGQGGNPLAHTLADRDWRVALVERDRLGGSCINYGCTPTKTMIASANIAHAARTAAEFGVDTSSVQVDLPRVIRRKNEIVRQMRLGQEQQVDSRPNLHLYRGVGSFVGGHTISVNGEHLRAPHIYIDTGTSPRIPQLPGLEDVPYYTNLNIIDLCQLPEHLLILGAGFLGLEFGQMFRRFGSKVTIIQHGPQIIPREDPDIAQALQSALEGEDISFVLDVRATSIARKDREIHLALTHADGSTSVTHGSHLLLAVGRTPNTPALNLANAGIQTDEHGYIKVNEWLETTAPGVWALGDVKGGPAFTHVSYDDHLIILDHLFYDGVRTTTDRVIPYALFTDPELGRVGLNGAEARKAGYRLKCGEIPMSVVQRARENGSTAGMMKLLVNAEDDQVLGAAILGSGGAELVQHLATMMRAHIPYTILRRAIYIHPTMTEGFYTLAARVQVLEEDDAD